MNGNPLCSMTSCPRAGVHVETAETGHWMVTIFYCAEHFRELELGTPLGPLGVDPARVSVEPLGRTEPAAPKLQPGIG